MNILSLHKMSSRVSEGPTYLKREGPAMHKNNKMFDDASKTAFLSRINSPSFSLLYPDKIGFHAFLRMTEKRDWGGGIGTWRLALPSVGPAKGKLWTGLHGSHGFEPHPAQPQTQVCSACH